MAITTTFKENLDIPVSITSYTDGTYKVEYCGQIVQCPNYEKAVQELGGCIMHSMGCAGKLEVVG